MGDYDNDGYVDLFVSYWGQNQLYRNRGDGTFENVTQKANLLSSRERWGTGCAFLDFDRDGYLDLFVANYIDFDIELAPNSKSGLCHYKGIKVACDPAGLQGGKNILYRNRGNGTFEDVSEKSRIVAASGTYGLGVSTLDFDNDGWIDIYVANDSNPSALYRNNRWTPSFMIPIDQTIWGFEREFGYATIASMVAPRPLIVVSSDQEGDTYLQRGGSNLEVVRESYKKLGSVNQFEIIALRPSKNNGSDYQAILAALNRQVQPGNSVSSAIVPGTTRIDQAELDRVRNLQFQELERAYSVLVADSYGARKKRWSQVDQGSVKKYEASIEGKRSAYFDFVGRYPKPSGPVRAFSKRIPEYETESFSGYHLSVDVYPGISAYGILLLPKGLKPGEKRPVVFTQHGAEGGPQYAIGLTDASQDRSYQKFGKRLAERGYVVFAPMICTQDKRRYELAQKAALLAKTIPGVELRKMNRVIDFLTTVPSADSSRIGFYGLFWGGFTSLWLPTGEPRLTAVITSGHFNDWSVKTTNLYLRTSYLRNGCAFDFYIFDILNHFDHSDLVSLIAPRPYLIEIGDEDGVNVKPYRLIEMEMDEVASVYEALGIRDRFEKNEFQGGHTIHGVESFLFLDRWLSRDWN